jgi:putative zinc finger protein
VTQELHCPELDQVGAYVLGALEPDERAAYEAHLGRCDECRDEYEALAHLPALLDLAAVAPPLAAPPGGEERLVATLRRAARRRRARTALLAAGTALAGAAAAAIAILGLGLGTSAGRPTPTIALAPTGVAVSGNAWATAKLHDHAAGSLVDFEAGGLPAARPGDRYVVYVRENGSTVARATFTVDRDGWAEVAMTSGRRIYPDAQLEVRRDAPGEPLVLKSST